MAAFLGMRGNGDWSDTDMRPKSWMDGVLWLYPNGDAPLTALLAKMLKGYQWRTLYICTTTEVRTSLW